MLTVFHYSKSVMCKVQFIEREMHLNFFFQNFVKIMYSFHIFVPTPCRRRRKAFALWKLNLCLDTMRFEFTSFTWNLIAYDANIESNTHKDREMELLITEYLFVQEWNNQ